VLRLNEMLCTGTVDASGVQQRSKEALMWVAAQRAGRPPAQGTWLLQAATGPAAWAEPSRLRLTTAAALPA
jgi:hypothetical protein